jgi:hypothetical protein
MVDSFASVVIDDLHAEGITINPSKADTPLIIDTDAVLAFAITPEGFEPIGRRNTQIIQNGSVAKHAQFATCHGLDIGGQAP